LSNDLAGMRRKIGSAEELHSVVRTMKAMAASNIGQYERAMRALADYDRAVELGLGACFRQLAAAGHAARAEGAAGEGGGIVGAVVFGSDQGLVGQFNETVAAHAAQFLASSPGPVLVWAVGEQVYARLADSGVRLMGLFAVPASIRSIGVLVGRILTQVEMRMERGGGHQLELFYNSSAAGAVYAPVRRRMLPLDEDWRRRLLATPWPTANLPEVLAGRDATLRALLREYLFISLFRASAESLASENASRLAAMERADRNIDELLEKLHRNFQRVRQTGIDDELFDVISGYEALPPNGNGGGAAKPRADGSARRGG
jgi:F-type H+-transporting ATPase subunit gamma